MKSLTLVIMAAGNSTRFCKDMTHNSELNMVKMQHNRHVFPATYKKTSHKTAVKKQWLRLGHVPLWKFVTQTLTHQILLCLEKMNCNLERNSHNAECESIFHTERDLEPEKANRPHPYKDGLGSSSLVLEKVIITAHSRDVAYMKKLIPSKLSFSLHADNQSVCEEEGLSQLHVPVQIVEGGNSRLDSLKNALNHVNTDYTVVNDCARFYTNKNVLEKMLTCLAEEEYDCIVPYLPATDTTLIYDAKTQKYSPLERSDLRLIQTPQISKTDKLKESMLLERDFSDESSAICALENTTIGFVLGSKDMAKLTFRDDLYLLKRFYNTHHHLRNNTPLIGLGSDIHAFIESKPMWLCGVKIESDFGFKAHSDGDVGIHAIIDSILGAMNYGDIGELFPDTSVQYKDIDSKILLQQVYQYCLSTGLEIINVDLTILAQVPKITPYKHVMQETLAEILCIEKSQISIKASTAEHLGFVGRKEGVFVQSIVQLKARVLNEL